jgi:hypothetical protein
VCSVFEARADLTERTVERQTGSQQLLTAAAYDRGDEDFRPTLETASSD